MYNSDSDCEAGVDSRSPLIIPETYNYVGVFLALHCNLRCSYCINRFGELDCSRPLLSGEAWVAGLNRIVSRGDLPITLQGGEPSLHPDFYEIINGIRPDLNIDLLTNLQFDVDEFMERVTPARIRREAPYASIRVSYHPESMDLDKLLFKVLKMVERGYSIGVWAVAHPQAMVAIAEAGEKCSTLGIDFRTKEFLGGYQGKIYGSYKFAGAIGGRTGRRVECRTSELLLGPHGDLYRCHSDLYGGRQSCGHLNAPDLQLSECFQECDYFGDCNPCDVKIKTNRFQEFGHTSVEIRFAEQTEAGGASGV
ncbi:MAG: radical SAM protein [Proteobacteria bacterium]|nr:radical SAM protein [Pseudomonadota bacterium]MBU1738360.1 radical SAM protein [Pseudomonadota bacterium]